MNWDDLRIFLAVARAPSLSAAAKRLGVNQSTVSRRLAAMEDGLQTRLTERTPGGHILTGAGVELLGKGQSIEDDFLRINNELTGRDQSLSGRLRITCVDMMVDRYLAPHLAKFNDRHPDIDLTLLTTFEPADMMRREADIAFRVSDKPPEPLVGRRLFTFALGVYEAAIPSKTIDNNADPADMKWIGWENAAYNSRMITDAFPTAKVRHRADSLFAASALVREGMGVAVLPCYWADQDSGLQRVYSKPVSNRDYGLWILIHPDVKRIARVRAFIDFITATFLTDRDLFEGRRPMPSQP